jgi:hypothetical protein
LGLIRLDGSGGSRWRLVPVGPRARRQVQVEVNNHRRELAAWLAVFEAAVQVVADVFGEPSDFAIASDHRNLLRIDAAQAAVVVSTLGTGVHQCAKDTGWCAKIKTNTRRKAALGRFARYELAQGLLK